MALRSFLPSTVVFPRPSDRFSTQAPVCSRTATPVASSSSTENAGSSPRLVTSTRAKHHYFRHLKAVASPIAPETTAPLTPAFVKPSSVREIFSAAELEAEMSASQEDDKLLVVEFTKRALPNSQKTYNTMKDLSGTTPDVVFVRVFADHSAECRELFVQNQVKQIPTYSFFRNGRKVHEETGMQPEKLKEQVLYYGQAEYPVQQLESAADVEALLKAHSGTGRLIVIQVTLTFCGPCVRVYPAVLQMSHKMTGSVVFGRLFGDSDDSTRRLVSNLGIVEAPTFLFYRDEELLGRYVGSGKGELVGEVLRYQGVQCT